jgi:hypothetical protein
MLGEVALPPEHGKNLTTRVPDQMNGIDIEFLQAQEVAKPTGPL